MSEEVSQPGVNEKAVRCEPRMLLAEPAGAQSEDALNFLRRQLRQGASIRATDPDNFCLTREQIVGLELSYCRPAASGGPSKKVEINEEAANCELLMAQAELARAQAELDREQAELVKARARETNARTDKADIPS